MNTEPHIVWKGLAPSEALDLRILHELGLLDKIEPRITACRVVIEQPHRHHRHGRHFQVKVEVSVPGRVLVVARDPDEHASAEDAHAAVNEAFWAMRRQLEDQVRLRRGDVKRHALPAEAVVRGRGRAS